MKIRFLIALLLLTGCGEGSIKDRVDTYGFDRFMNEALAFRETGDLSEQMQKEFEILNTQVYLNGVALILRESDSYRSGIYIDSESLDGWGGSGFELEAWTDQIGWFTEKKRTGVAR